MDALFQSSGLLKNDLLRENSAIIDDTRKTLGRAAEHCRANMFTPIPDLTLLVFGVVYLALG